MSGRNILEGNVRRKYPWGKCPRPKRIYCPGVYYPGYVVQIRYCPKILSGILYRGDIVQRDVARGILPRGILS